MSHLKKKGKKSFPHIFCLQHAENFLFRFWIKWKIEVSIFSLLSKWGETNKQTTVSAGQKTATTQTPFFFLVLLFKYHLKKKRKKSFPHLFCPAARTLKICFYAFEFKKKKWRERLKFPLAVFFNTCLCLGESNKQQHWAKTATQKRLFPRFNFQALTSQRKICVLKVCWLVRMRGIEKEKKIQNEKGKKNWIALPNQFECSLG